MRNLLTQSVIAEFILLMASMSFMAAAQEGDQTTNNRRWSLEAGANLDFLQDKLPQFHHNN